MVAAPRSTARRCDACAAALAGTHDFTAFTPTETDHLRFERDVLRGRLDARDGDVLEFWIEADSFMRHMNRVLVGRCSRSPAAAASLESFARLLAGAPAQRGRRDRAAARPLPRRPCGY